MTETEAIRENYNLGVLAGEAREQQRIIKLLEELSKAYYKTGAGSAIEVAGYEKAIALIKGEN